MYTLADRYEQGQHVLAWTDALALRDLGPGTHEHEQVAALVRVTMQRVRKNIEHLIAHLEHAGWMFASATPLLDPAPDIQEQLDEFERVAGPLPAALRGFAVLVGQVDLNGHLPGWALETPDPLVVETPVDYWTSELREWESERGTEWEQPSPFVVELAPDRLHKANISGGAPYAMAVPNAGADGLLIGEHHQTTLTNYLRVCFEVAGMGGVDVAGDGLPEALRGAPDKLVAV